MKSSLDVKQCIETVDRLKADVSDILAQVDDLMEEVENALSPIFAHLHTFFVILNGYHSASIELTDIQYDKHADEIECDFLIFVSSMIEPFHIPVQFKVEHLDNIGIIEQHTVRGICNSIGIFDITSIETIRDLAELMHQSKQTVVDTMLQRETVH